MGSHWLQARDYKTARWADACKLARRQVVVPLAAALLKHGLEEALACRRKTWLEASARGSAVELEEASEMARSRDRERVARLPEFKEPVPLSADDGHVPGHVAAAPDGLRGQQPQQLGRDDEPTL